MMKHQFLLPLCTVVGRVMFVCKSCVFYYVVYSVALLCTTDDMLLQLRVSNFP